jgi:AcrR family transcriptional regulator
VNTEDFCACILDASERLIGQIGFKKTTVADIAREMQMSPANVYRFFASKAEINDAVCRRLFEKIESAVEQITAYPGPASRALWNVFAALNRLNAELAFSDGKLHQLLTTAYSENWPAVRAHQARMDQLFGQLIGRGMASGEFSPGDAEACSRLFHSICLKYCYGPTPGETGPESEPVMHQIADFCLAALTNKEARVQSAVA